MTSRPSRFTATPAEIDAFLREHFAQDILLRFYQTVGDAVLDEALCRGAEFRESKQAEQGKHVYLAGMTDVMQAMWDYRYYPAVLPDMEHRTYRVIRKENAR